MPWLSRYWMHLVLAAVVAYFAIALYGNGVGAGRAQVLADWQASQLVAAEAVRQLEHTWQERVATARTEADEKEKQLIAGVERVSANTDRLHVAALSAAKRGACKDATAAQGDRDSGLLLADVLNRVGKRAGELAAYADRQRIAAEECRAGWPR